MKTAQESGQRPSFIEFSGSAWRGEARVLVLSLGVSFRRCNSGRSLSGSRSEEAPIVDEQIVLGRADVLEVRGVAGDDR